MRASFNSSINKEAKLKGMIPPSNLIPLFAFGYISSTMKEKGKGAIHYYAIGYMV